MMTAPEIRAYRKKHYGTQQRMANALGITRAAIANYEAGIRPVPQIVVNLLNCLSTTDKGGFDADHR